jgi:intracellular septation protein A
VAVSLSAVVLLGVIAFLLVKKAGLNIGHAIVCVLFGFFLAGSSAAPSIRDGVQNAVQLIGKIDF